jgi:hypothetical protein
MPSQCGMTSTVVAFRVAPLSPCSTGRAAFAWTPSASVVRLAKFAACSVQSVSCTSKPTILRLSRSRIRYRVARRYPPQPPVNEGALKESDNQY